MIESQSPSSHPDMIPDDCIVFDTETTGFDPAEGDRLVEIGAVRMRGGLPTGDSYHTYINPERNVPDAAVKIHGLTTAFLSDKPLFGEIVHDFLNFVGDLPMVAHNAPFDEKFVNAELTRLGIAPVASARFIDTVPIARKRFPGAQASLDALCRRFRIPLDGRDKHGALVDSELLAEVVVELNGGRQASLFGGSDPAVERRAADAARPLPAARGFVLKASPEERAAHAAFIKKTLGEENLWKKLLETEPATA